MPNTLHVISHTHWDREWYMPFEKHRLRLVDLIDLLLDIFANEPDYKHFHLDGQAIVLEDYLQVRPEREADLRRAAKDGKLSLGPWYVLQDEFLTSGEANVRNMMAGLKLARRFGEPCMVGYLPDSFGNISQMPQLLRGFGIDNAVFGRGINRYDAARAEAGAPPTETGYKSELTWRAPDGSDVLGIFMAHWYSNAMDIPAAPEEAVAFMVPRRDAAASLATTSQLLMMNGCDHTPTRRDVGSVIKSIKGRLGEDKIKHSTFAKYLRALRAEVSDLQVHEGEMRSEFSDGWGTLANTLSARLYQKRANFACQALYEKWVEPLSAFAWLVSRSGCRSGHSGYDNGHSGRDSSHSGRDNLVAKPSDPGKIAGATACYPADQIWYGWRTLMQNHPHDSICGCSCDEVHREMDTRFDKARQVGDALVASAASAIADAIDTTCVFEGSVPVVVFNPLPYPRTETVRLTVDFPKEATVLDIEVTSSADECVPSRIVADHGVVWDYTLPDDRFRETFEARRLTIEVLATNVPGLGYETYCVTPVAANGRKHEENLVADTPEGCVGVLENEFLKVQIAVDGSLTVTDKAGGATFSGLNVYEDTGDVGDEYVYRAPEKDARLTTAGVEAYVALYRRPTGDQLAEIGQSLPVPRRCADPDKTDEIGIGTQLFLGAQARRLEVYVTIANTATDHRIRALFPTNLQAQVASADGQFDIVQRSIVPAPMWTNPSNPQPQQAFVDVSDGDSGLTIANRGLPEYEVLRDGSNTIAITLLRCVGRLGDWGDFPTPDAQCLGEQRAAYAIVPHAGGIDQSSPDGPAAIAYSYITPMWGLQRRTGCGASAACLPPSASLITLDPANVVLSAIKKAEDRDSLILRVYNPFPEAQRFDLGCLRPLIEAYLVNLAEERLEPLPIAEGKLSIHAAPKKIVTVELILA
jgi:alpha-mannosidase/mannosylglycerate hydrolase